MRAKMATGWEFRSDSSESDSDDDDIAIAAAAVVLLDSKTKRRCWIRDWVAQRDRLGAYGCLLRELMVHDPKAHRQFVRMTHESFCELLELVDPLIRRKDTIMRKSIKPAERLAVTLRYLASGR